jgi:hypothetical protein
MQAEVLDSAIYRAMGDLELAFHNGLHNAFGVMWRRQVHLTLLRLTRAMLLPAPA